MTCYLCSPPALKFVLLNKNDLELQLHTHLVTAFADRNDCTHVFSTSAKTGQFNAVTWLLYNYIVQYAYIDIHWE